MLGGGLSLFFFTSAAFSQTPASQYLQQVRRARPDPTIKAAQVKSNPRAYVGKTFEFKGIYRGFVGSEENEEGVLLLFDKAELSDLRMSRKPEWLQPNSLVRILCVATPVPEGELRIGWPDFTLVAIADASEVDLLEESLKPPAPAPRPDNIRLVPPPTAPDTNPPGPRPPRFKGPRSAATSPERAPSVRLSELPAQAQSVFAPYRDYIKNHNRRLSDAQADSITYAILKFSHEWDMDPRLIVATIVAESDFRIKETSHAGAMGLIQLMPDEVQRLKLTNPYDPIQNVMGGIFLLKERLNKYSGSASFKDASMQHIILALASYNAGMGAVKKYGGVPPYRETQGYVKRIEKLYRELCASDGG